MRSVCYTWLVVSAHKNGNKSLFSVYIAVLPKVNKCSMNSREDEALSSNFLPKFITK